MGPTRGTSTALLCPRNAQATSALQGYGIAPSGGKAALRGEERGESFDVEVDVCGSHDLADRVHRQLGRANVDRDHPGARGARGADRGAAGQVGAVHVAELEQMARRAGRPARERTTLYGRVEEPRVDERSDVTVA